MNMPSPSYLLYPTHLLTSYQNTPYHILLMPLIPTLSTLYLSPHYSLLCCESHSNCYLITSHISICYSHSYISLITISPSNISCTSYS